MKARLIITNVCNGTCNFCHHEGDLFRNESFNSDHISDVSFLIRHFGITDLVISGGEPTCNKNLVDIITCIKKKHRDVQIGLATNGYRVAEIIDCINRHLNRIDISLSSFKPDIFSLYTNVSPSTISKLNIKVPITFNVVLHKHNIDEINTFLQFALVHKADICFMNELPLGKNYPAIRDVIHKQIIERFQLREVEFSGIRKYKAEFGNINILVKTPELSRLQPNKICINCVKFDICGEYGKYLRIYSNLSYSFCPFGMKNVVACDSLKSLPV